MSGLVRLCELGRCEYEATLAAMRRHVASRRPDDPDEIWLLEHCPVFTLGQAARIEHLLAPGDIPVCRSDRGGQVTYHGPGQLVVYVLLDLRRARLGVKRLVAGLEQTVIDVLAEASIAADRRCGAPGVYVDGRKVAALGLRVRNGISYHGLSLNVDLDLSPFQRIDPCGYRGLEVSSTAELGVAWTVAEAAERVTAALLTTFALKACPADAAPGGVARC